MATDLLTPGKPSAAGSVEEQARRAVSAFRALQPTLTSYARILSGNKRIRVDMAATDNGSTDGERIYFRPPIALGDNTQHVRKLCDKRDERGLMKCMACAIREEVLVTIYHEIAHICFESFARTTAQDKRRAIEFAAKEAKGPWARQIEDRIKNAPPHVTGSYIGLCGLINEYLPFLLNCMEDARVNRELFKARKGVKRMFAADVQKVFDEGFECADGKGGTVTKSWREAPLNSQAMIGVFAKASGYDQYENWFHSKVVEALNDEQLSTLIRELDTVRSANGVYNLSFRVLARLRDLGYCGTPQDPDPEPEPEPEESDEQDDAEESGERGESGDSESPSDDLSDDSDSEESPSDGDGSDEGTPDSGEPAPDSDDAGDPSDSSEGEGSENSQADSDAPEGSSGTDEVEQGELDESDSVDSSDSDGDADPSGGAGSGTDEQGEVDEGDQDQSEGSSESGDSDQRDDAGGSSEGAGDPDSSESGSDSGSASDMADEAGSDGSSGEMGLPEGASPDGGDPELSQEAGSEADAADPSSDMGDTGRPESSGEVADGGGDEGVPQPDDAGTPGLGTDSHRDDGPDAPDLHDSEDAGEDRSADAGDPEPIDTGADDGYGGTAVVDENYVEPEMGTPDEIDPILRKWGDHEEKPKSIDQQTAEEAENKAIDQAIIQGLYFTKPSSNIFGVREHFYGKPIIIGSIDVSRGWVKRDAGQALRRGQGLEIDIDEGILQPALLRLRRVFTDNKRGKLDSNRKSGRVNAAVLGRRAWNNDPRLFSKKTQPGKKDYFVVIGMDISGSTTGKNIMLEKRAVFAKAELLDRLGIPFAVLAHTGSKVGDHCLDMYHIKDEHEPWNDKTKERLVQLGPAAANLDGHALEFLRKVADKSKATDKIIMYYSDGKMPLENYAEELEILQREIKYCASRGYTLLGVGIRTDSPRAHGLDTVEVHGDDDLGKVVTHLESRLSATANRR